MKWIKTTLAGHWWAVTLFCILSSLIALASVAQSLAVRNFVDSAVAGSRQAFFHWLLIFFLLIFFQLVGGAVYSLLYEATLTSMNNQMKQKFFHTILTRDYTKLRGYHSGDYMQRIFGDCGVVTGNALSLIPQITTLVTKLIAAIVFLAVLQWKLTIILLVCFFVMLGAAMPLRGIIRKFHKRAMEASGEVRGVLQEVLDNQLVVRSFQAVNGVESNAMEKMAHHRKTVMKSAVLSQVMSSGCSTAINMVYLIGLIWCGIGIINGRISYGTLYAIWELVGKITGPAMQASGILPQYYAMTSSAERLEELENLEKEQVDSSVDWMNISERFTEIRCQDVCFSYEKEDIVFPVLKNLNLTIQRGDFIAIVGDSGIGKSTLLKLLLGIYHPENPSLYAVTAGDTKTVIDAGARSMISYVPQGNFLMSGTIRESIHFWQKEQMDEEKLLKSCKIAEADGFISNLEEGFDTQLGERGAGLSEGQLQRLAIARAIYSDKPVLLLDEATSALDEVTEAKVLENLKELKNRTVIIVTHRKAALDICNRIVKMDDGKIVEVNKS